MKKKVVKSPKAVSVFSSIDQENEAEYRRRAKMTPAQRLDEFATLQERLWGRRWTHEPMKRIVSIEKITW
jgi:hypothetical protein